MGTMWFGDFVRRCKAGFWALGIAIVLWPIVFLTSSASTNGRWNTNDKISAENKETTKKWREERALVAQRNAVIRAFEAGSTAGIRGLGSERAGRYTELMIRLAGEATPEQRIESYCYLIGAATLPDSTPLGLSKVFSDEGLPPAERVSRFISYRTADTQGYPNVVDEVANQWVGGRIRPSVQPLPPRPSKKPHVKADWLAWNVFAIVLYGIANLAMVIGYFLPMYDRRGDPIPLWDAPVNPGSWLIMAVFAPAFAVPWFFRGVYFTILRPLFWGIGGTGRGIKWLLVDFSVEEVARKGRERRERKCTERQRRAAEEQMAVAEQVKVGADVAALRIELKALIGQAKLVQDKSEREQLIRRLSEVESKLESTAQKRASKTKTGNAPAGITEQVEDITTRIDALYESENI